MDAFKTEKDYLSEGFIGILCEMAVGETMTFHGHEIYMRGHGVYEYKEEVYNGPALETHMSKLMGRTV